MAFKTHRHLAWLAIAVGTLTFTQFGAVITQALFSPAHAQEITETDVANYANAVFDIEVLRIAAYDAADQTLITAGSEVGVSETPLSCTASDMSDMPDMAKPDQVSLRTVLVEFCNEASDAVRANSLTPQEFNAITAAHQADPALAEQIQAVLSDL